MTDSSEVLFFLPPETLEHYATGYEALRLQGGTSQIEMARTQELVMRYVPPPSAVIFDVGGGPGVYACWLANFQDQRRRELFLTLLRRFLLEPSLLGASAHLMAVARKE